MNKVILLGRMARDPEVRFTQAAEPMAICRFSIAVDRPYSSRRQEGEKTVDFINCVCFGKRGENIGKLFRKGQRIVVTGRLQVSDWTDNSGNKRYSTDVVVEDFDFCENKGDSQGSGADFHQSSGFSPAPSASSNNSSSFNDGFYAIENGAEDDNIPF
jgi:single-strand DNA-binding protein